MDNFETVYFDNTVLINDLYIKIFKYYLPLATSKTIFFREISHIIYHPNRSINVTWGASSDKFKDWFPFDERRNNKKGYFEIVLKDKGIRPCFSPIDPQRVYNIIWINHSEEGKKWKEQSSKSMQPVILLSSKEDSVQNSQTQSNIRILFDPICHETIRSDDIISRIRSINKNQREPLKELRNDGQTQDGNILENKQQKFTAVKYIDFEEQSIEGYELEKENNQLIEEEGDFEELS